VKVADEIKIVNMPQGNKRARARRFRPAPARRKKEKSMKKAGLKERSEWAFCIGRKVTNKKGNPKRGELLDNWWEKRVKMISWRVKRESEKEKSFPGARRLACGGESSPDK